MNDEAVRRMMERLAGLQVVSSDDDDDFDEEDSDNDDEDYDNDEDYYYEEEEDDDDDSFVELDPAVEAEMDRRRKDETTITEPPSCDILDEVRSYFLEQGGQPAFYGGYLDIMEKLGAIHLVSTTDPLVKDSQYNVWGFFLNDDQQSEEEVEEKMDKMLEQYRSRVRLLRYKEYIQHQQSVGLGISPDWFDGTSADEHPLNGIIQENDDQDNSLELDDNNNASTVKKEWEFTMDEIFALNSAWAHHGFYSYVNHEAIYVGLAAGQEGVQDLGGVARMFQFEMSQGSLFEQVEELKRRYSDLKCPLGPKAQFEPKKKQNKKKKKKGNGIGAGLGTHAQEIQERLKTLLQTILRTMSSKTGGIGQLVAVIAEMLQAACHADTAVARALIQDTSVLELRQRALEYAKDADNNMESRPLEAASVWWNAYDDLTAVIGISIRALREGDKSRNGDSDEAAEYFTNHVRDAFFASIQSTCAAERFSVLRMIGIIICCLPIKIFQRVIKDAEKWQLLQDACKINAFEDQQQPKRNYRQQKRQDVYATFAACEAIGFFSRVGQLGMEIDNNTMFSTGVIPGKGATRVIHKGIVPILLEIADSGELAVAVKAMEGLGQLSRVKDCRVLFWQHPDAAELVHKCLKSSNMEMVSETLLFVLHLLWDSEYSGKLMSLANPPLEEVAVQWAAYAMQKTIDKSTEIRKQSKIESDKATQGMIERYRQRDRNDIIAKERDKLEDEERLKAVKNKVNWFEFETDKNRGNQFTTALCRTILVLGTMQSEDPGRLLKVNALHIVNCCIDVPTLDLYQGSATMLTNILAWRGAENIVPEMFPDPEHLVQSIIDRIEWLAKHNIHGQQAAVFTILASRLFRSQAWKPCFQKVEAISDMYEFWINGPIGQMSLRRPPDLPKGQGRTREQMTAREVRDATSNSVNPKCGALTGKLKACDNCSKLETKLKEFKSCAGCQSVSYCSRDCQVKDWKTHKKACKQLSAQKIGKENSGKCECTNQD